MKRMKGSIIVGVSNVMLEFDVMEEGYVVLMVLKGEDRCVSM